MCMQVTFGAVRSSIVCMLCSYRSYVCFDIGRRVLERLLQKPIIYAMGVTDVDDKIIARATELGRCHACLVLGVDLIADSLNTLTGVPASEIAQRFEAEFMRDMSALGVQPPSVITRVSENIASIIDHIRAIEAAGFAYTAADGSAVYLDTGAMGTAYGKLRPLQSQATGGEAADASNPGAPRPPVGAAAKRSPADFALWKAVKPSEESVGAAWPSPWGLGRPGWHVECRRVYGGGHTAVYTT